MANARRNQGKQCRSALTNGATFAIMNNKLVVADTLLRRKTLTTLISPQVATPHQDPVCQQRCPRRVCQIIVRAWKLRPR